MEKLELPYIEEIIQRLVEAYLDKSNQSPWFVAFSNGKDSSAMGYAIWKAVERIPEPLRNRMVYFATSDTLLEHPEMKELMGYSYQHMNEVAKEKGLPIEAFLVQPQMSAMKKMLGHGNPLPTPKGSVNRWCTDLLKLKPMQNLQNQLIKQHGSIILMVGTRTEESQKRANSIKKHGVEGEFIFPVKGEKQRSDGTYAKYQAMPIVHLTTDEVWRTITHARKLPWRTRATTIRKMYEGAGECPVQVDKSIGKPCGGSSRNGCVLCMMGGGTDDQMLKAFIEKGEDWAIHVNRLRKLIRESLYDARMRRPINHWRKKKMNWANPFLEDYEEKKEEWAIADKTKATREVFIQDDQDRQSSFKKVSEGLCHDTTPVYPNLSLAGYTLQARIFLFKAVLYTQEQAGIQLVSQEEINYIKKVWTEDCGWEENEADLKPEFPNYEGALVLNPDYSINVEDEYGIVTTIPNLTIYADGVCMETGETVSLPPIDTKKMNPPKRKMKRMTRKEAIAEHNRTRAKTINVNSKIQERFEAFYIEREWGGDEVSIINHLDRSARTSKRYIPFYWMPSHNMESRINWQALHTYRHTVYWNTVTFIVCEPHIKSREEAIKYVDWYIEQGEEKKSYLQLLEENQGKGIEEQYKPYLQMESRIAKQELLRKGEDPDYVPDVVKSYAKVTDEELTIARVMRYQTHNAEKVAHYCQGETWKYVSELLVEGLEKHEARQFLLERAYPPHVLPGYLSMRVGLGNLFLKKSVELRRKGIAGKGIRKHFPLSFWIKGMSPEQARDFIIQTGYHENEVTEEVRSFAEMNQEMFIIAEKAKKEGCPLKHITATTEKVVRILELFTDAQANKHNHNVALKA